MSSYSSVASLMSLSNFAPGDLERSISTAMTLMGNIIGNDSSVFTSWSSVVAFTNDSTRVPFNLTTPVGKGISSSMLSFVLLSPVSKT